MSSEQKDFLRVLRKWSKIVEQRVDCKSGKTKLGWVAFDHQYLQAIEMQRT